MKFRWQTGSLEESLKTEVEIKSLNDVRDIIKTRFPITSDDKIEASYYGYDPRCDQSLHIVTVNSEGVGFISNFEVDETEAKIINFIDVLGGLKRMKDE